MRRRFLISASALAGALCLGSCSSSLVPSAAQSTRSGVASQFSLREVTALPDVGSGISELAVTDFGTGGVDVLNGSYRRVALIKKGISGPVGDWIDAKGNLYVANSFSTSVTEYKKGATSPSFTYSKGLKNPAGVTTDANGNVYVGDFSSNSIFEFHQHSNSLVAQCSAPGGVTGVAVDASSDVFFAYNVSSTGPGGLGEFSGGLAGCNETTLAPTLGAAGGVILDLKNNLVASDQTNGSVDVIAPPYSAITKTLTGFNDPFYIALNAKNNVLFVAETAGFDVAVVKYPSGAAITKLGSKNGISEPIGVAAFPPEK